MLEWLCYCFYGNECFFFIISVYCIVLDIFCKFIRNIIMIILLDKEIIFSVYDCGLNKIEIEEMIESINGCFFCFLKRLYIVNVVEKIILNLLNLLK